MPITLPLDEMTVEEKLQLMEAIWENLSLRSDELPSPVWHGDLLRERERRVEAGETAFIPWEQARENLRLRAANDEP